MDQVNMLKETPQLIVAFDSLNDNSNYIHIDDVKDNTTYYCPCCRGVVKPRAYKKDIEYKVQPHYYHVTEGCSEESFIHYICKEWLFTNGCKFKIAGTIYTVSSIDVEKPWDTCFGKYIPDITVYTVEDKTFFFEIKMSNKKTIDYIPKWDQLGNDVVEVDVKYLVNQKCKDDIPEFELIYSDGECFISSYISREYNDVISKRKHEWKRQDKLNYKIRWERLDWFWEEIGKFKNNLCELPKVIDTFSAMDISDQEECYELLHKQSCFKPAISEIRAVYNENFKQYYTKEKIEELLGYDNFKCEKIYFSNLNKSSIEIQGRFILSTDGFYKEFNYCFEEGDRKWIYSHKTLDIVLQCFKDRHKFVLQRYEQLLSIYYQFLNYSEKLNQVLSDIQKQYFSKENCIWDFQYRPNDWKYLIDIDILNSNRCFHMYTATITIKGDENYKKEVNVSFTCKELNIYTTDQFKEELISRLERTMQNIYERVLWYDGIKRICWNGKILYRKKRKLFINKEEK